MTHTVVLGFLMFAGGFAVGIITLSGYWLMTLSRAHNAWQFILNFMKGVKLLHPWISPDERGIVCPSCGHSLTCDPEDEQGESEKGAS